MIYGKVNVNNEDCFSLKSTVDNKIYSFRKIQFYNKNFNKINDINITDLEVCFLDIDFSNKNNQYRIINFKDKGFFLEADYLQSFKLNVKEIEMDEDKFKSVLKEMGTITYDEFMNMMGK